MENEVENKLESSTEKCQNCGAALRFSPKSQTLYCDCCESSFPIENNTTVIKHDYVDDAEHCAGTDSWKEQTKIIKCSTCGAQVEVNGLEFSQVCPYCGSNYVAEAEELPGLTPDMIIPFAFDEEEAAKKFAAGVKKKFFVPSSFKKHLPKNLIHSVYIPTFSFDCKTISQYRGTLDKVTTRTNSKGKTEVRHHYFDIKGTKTLDHNNHIIESSSKIDKAQMDSLLPFTPDRVYQYKPDYLRGYCVEHYCDSLNACYEIARKDFDEVVKKQILSQYDYTNVVSLSISTDYTNRKYCYFILPMYNFEFVYNKKKYFALMNGETGKIGKGLPVSVLKVGGLVLLGLILLGLFIWLVLAQV